MTHFLSSPLRKDSRCNRLPRQRHRVFSKQWRPRIIIRRYYLSSWAPKPTGETANEKLLASARISELFHFFNFYTKNISRDNAIQKSIKCEMWLISFPVPWEEIAGVTDCRDNDTGSFSNNDDQGSSSAGNISSWKPKWSSKIENDKLKASENFWDCPFYNFSMKTISRYNTIQKAINWELWLIFFPVPWEKIAGVTDCRDNDTGSFSNNDNHPEFQNELKKLRIRNYKRARDLLRYSYFITFQWKIIVAITQFKKQ